MINKVLNNKFNYANKPTFKGERPRVPTGGLDNKVIYSKVPLNQNYPINPKITIPYTKIETSKTPFRHEIHLYKLQNGHKIAIVPKGGSTIVKTFVDSGSMNETDNIRGISHFIEHNLFNGSSTIAPGTFFNKVSALGAETNASTNFAQTDYYIQSAIMTESDLDKVIEMQGDMIYRPLFDKNMIEKEKGPVTSEISMVVDNDANMLYNSLIKKMFNIDTNSNSLVAGSIETVSRLNQNDLVDYHKRHYTPNNMYTVIVGNVDPEKVIPIVAKHFNGQEPTEKIFRREEKITPAEFATREDHISKKSDFSLSMVGFKGPEAQNIKDEIILNAINLILLKDSSSRLSKKLREFASDGAMSIEKVSLKDNDPTAMVLMLQTPKGYEQKGIDALYDTIYELKTNPISQEEFEIAKTTMLKNLSLGFETSEGICDYIGESLLSNNFKDLPNYRNIIKNLTIEDINNAINKYFNTSKATISVMHARGTTTDEIVSNYNRSKYAVKNNNISFTGKIQNTNLSTEDVKEYILKDGSYLAISNSTTDMSYMNWKLTNWGATPKNPATHYVLAQILNNGTASRTREELEKNAGLKGIEYSFDANGFSITANADCFHKDTIETINMLKETIYSPNFTQKEFEKAKEKIKAYMETLPKSASNTLIAQLYPDYFATSESILKGLKKLTLEDVKIHWANLLENASSNFVITAPIKRKENLESEITSSVYSPNVKFKEHRGKLNAIYKPTTKSEIYIGQEERNQAEIFKTYSFKMTGNIKDDVKYELLNTILGGNPASRLFQDLREKQKLAYQVASQVQSFGDTGIISLYTKTTTDNKEQNDIHYENVQKSLEGFEYHAQKLQTELVSDEELESAKKYLKQSVAYEMELLSSRTNLLAINADLPYGIKRIDEYFKQIDQITKEDIRQAARHIFSNKPIYSILASPDTIKDQTPYLNSLTA